MNFTNWNVLGPQPHKINTVKAMFKRLKVICSDELTLKKDLEELRMSFIVSNYPINLLNRLFSEKLERQKLSLAPQKFLVSLSNFEINSNIIFNNLIKKLKLSLVKKYG